MTLPFPFGDCLCRRRNTLLTPLLFTHFSSALYEQGTHAKLNQIHDYLRALRRECNGVLRDLKTKQESGVQVDK